MLPKILHPINWCVGMQNFARGLAIFCISLQNSVSPFKIVHLFAKRNELSLNGEMNYPLIILYAVCAFYCKNSNISYY